MFHDKREEAKSEGRKNNERSTLPPMRTTRSVVLIMGCQ
jgi:hypothetical protein